MRDGAVQPGAEKVWGDHIDLTQNPTGRGPGQPAVSDPAWAGGSDQVEAGEEVPSSWKFCYSVLNTAWIY